MTLTGKRSQLVPMQEAHTEALFLASQYTEIWSWLTERQPSSVEGMARIVKQALSRQQEGLEQPFVIIDQQTGQVVGSTRMYDFAPAHRQLEIGSTWLTPSVWRTRINTECKYLLLRHCFDSLGLVRVQLKTDGRNVRSQAAIARLGATKEGVLRRHKILPDGFVRDSVIFSVIDEEWPRVRQRLEDFLEN